MTTLSSQAAPALERLEELDLPGWSLHPALNSTYCKRLEAYTISWTDVVFIKRI